MADPIQFALNSLTSPAMVAATLASLGSHAHLAEISKRDIWSPQRVSQERPDVSYKIIAIDLLSTQVASMSQLQHLNVPYRRGMMMMHIDSSAQF